MPLMKSVIKTSGKSVLIPLRLSTAVSATHAVNKYIILGLRTTTLNWNWDISWK